MLFDLSLLYLFSCIRLKFPYYSRTIWTTPSSTTTRHPHLYSVLSLQPGLRINDLCFLPRIILKTLVHTPAHILLADLSLLSVLFVCLFLFFIYWLPTSTHTYWSLRPELNYSRNDILLSSCMLHLWHRYVRPIFLHVTQVRFGVRRQLCSLLGAGALCRPVWTRDLGRQILSINHFILFSHKRSLTCAYFLLLEGHYATLQDGRQAHFRTVSIVPFAHVYCLFGFCIFRPRVGFLSICFAASPAKYMYFYLCYMRAIQYYATSARLYWCTPLHLTYVSCSYLLFQCAYKYFIIYLYPCPFISQLPTDTHFFSPVRNFFQQPATPRRSCASPRTNNQRIKNWCCEGLNDITMKHKV